MPIELLRFAVVSVAFSVAYLAVLTIHERMPKRQRPTVSAILNGPYVGFVGSSSYKDLPAYHGATSHPSNEASPPIQVGEYFRLYGERQNALLASDSTNLNPEAVERAGDWKRAGDWDQGFLQMNETLKARMDPALPQAVPSFPVPGFQVPPVQIPVVP